MAVVSLLVELPDSFLGPEPHEVAVQSVFGCFNHLPRRPRLQRQDLQGGKDVLLVLDRCQVNVVLLKRMDELAFAVLPFDRRIQGLGHGRFLSPLGGQLRR